MTDKEQLWYLIQGLIDGSYETKTFCNEFSRIYNLETDYNNLTINEYHELLFYPQKNLPNPHNK